MRQATTCAGFDGALDAYLDNELNPLQRAELLEHARACPECGEKLEFTDRLMTMCAELDEGMTMPIEGQAAWRKAVRDEAAKVRPRKWFGAWQTLGVIAAAFVVFGGMYALLGSGELSLKAQNFYLGSNTSVQTTTDTSSVTGGYDSSGGKAKLIARMDGEIAPEESLDAFDDAQMDKAEIGGYYPQSSGFDPEVLKTEIKVIKTASRSIDSITFDNDLQTISDLVEEYGGSFENSDVYGTPLEAGSTHGRSAYLYMRIPTAELPSFLSALDVVGEVTQRGESAQDISMQYYDTQGRLDSSKALRDELQSMIASANGVSELIEIKRELSSVQSDIDSLEGTLRGWDSQIEYSSVTVHMNEVQDKKSVQKIDQQSLKERIEVGFAESINMFMTFVQKALVLIVMFWPFIVLALILIIIVCAVVRRRRRKF